MVTLEQVEAAVERHAPMLVPGWAIGAKLHEFEDWNDDDVLCAPGRADISMACERFLAAIRVDPRTSPVVLEELVCHELAHCLCYEYDWFVMNSIDRIHADTQKRLTERLAWAIADLYLAARKRGE